MESSSGYSIGFKCRCSRKLYVQVTTEPFSSETALETCPHVVEPILHSLTFEDVGRLLQLEGHAAERVEHAVTGGPGWRTTGHLGFDAVPYFEESAPGSPQYRALWLTASFRFAAGDADAVLHAVAPLHAQGHITREADGTLTVVQAIVVAGGVTEAHLQFQLRAWRRVLQQVADCAREIPEDDRHE
jgi:hypothetical protein